MAKKKQQKTNAARILDKLGIAYELKEYEVDESDLSAVHVASSVGMPIERVYKTLVARGDKNGIVMAVIQGDLELDVRYVRHIGKYAFQDCINLKTLDFSRKTDDYIPVLDSPHAFMMQDLHTLVNETFQIVVPNSLLDKWRNSVNWSAVKNHIIGV
jgi:hypothetical protein